MIAESLSRDIVDVPIRCFFPLIWPYLASSFLLGWLLCEVPPSTTPPASWPSLVPDDSLSAAVDFRERKQLYPVLWRRPAVPNLSLHVTGLLLLGIHAAFFTFCCIPSSRHLHSTWPVGSNLYRKWCTFILFQPYAHEKVKIG